MFLSNVALAKVGIGTTVSKNTLVLNGNLLVKHINLTGSTTVTSTDDGINLSINPTATDQELILPNPISSS